MSGPRRKAVDGDPAPGLRSARTEELDMGEAVVSSE